MRADGLFDRPDVHILCAVEVILALWKTLLMQMQLAWYWVLQLVGGIYKEIEKAYLILDAVPSEN